MLGTSDTSYFMLTIKSSIHSTWSVISTQNIINFYRRSYIQIVWKFCINGCYTQTPRCTCNKSEVSLFIQIVKWTRSKVSLNFCIIRCDSSSRFLNNKSFNRWSCINSRTCRNNISHSICLIKGRSCISSSLNKCSWSCSSKSRSSKTYNSRINCIFSWISGNINIPLRICSIKLNWVSNITRVLIRYSTYNSQFSTLCTNWQCITINCIIKGYCKFNIASRKTSSNCKSNSTWS